MNIRHIIREEIEKLVVEKKGKKSSSKKDAKDSKESNKKKKSSSKDKKDEPKAKSRKDNNGIRKNALKDRNGRRKSFNYKEYNKDNPNSSYSDNAQLANFLKNPAINVAAIGRMIYPDHTPEGAQSQLRKKIEGEKSDSGKEYRFRNKEIRDINRALNNLGIR